MATKYVYFLFADDRFFAKAFSEDMALEIIRIMKEIFPAGTHYELKIFKNMEDEKNDK